MKLHTQYLTLILFMLLSLFGCVNSDLPTNSTGNGIDSVNWVGSEVIFTNIEGKKEYSIIFFYADWCGYCHEMDQTTFSDAMVVGILDQSFNSVRVNAESDTLLVHFDSTVTGRQMKAIYEISGYPTICVFKGDGEHIFTVVGYASPADFTAGLNRILDGVYD